MLPSRSIARFTTLYAPAGDTNAASAGTLLSVAGILFINQYPSDSTRSQNDPQGVSIANVNNFPVLRGMLNPVSYITAVLSLAVEIRVNPCPESAQQERLWGIHSGPVCDHRYVLPPRGYNLYVISAIRTITILFAALLLLAGCNNKLIKSQAVSGLQKTAADYYNFKVGNLPGREYASFLSPAYRKSFSKDALETLNRGNAMARSSNNRIEKLRSEDVAVSIEGNFAMTDVPGSAGFAFESMEPQRWVKSGSKWYIYLGSDSEVSDYGYFPVSIPFPQIPEQQPAQVLEDKQRKDSPALPGNGEAGEASDGGTDAGSG